MINLYRWTSGTWSTTVGPVTGSGAVNAASIAAADDIFGSAIDASRFGEAAIDLTTLIGTAPGQVACSAFNQLNTRSRSSNAVTNAALTG